MTENNNRNNSNTTPKYVSGNGYRVITKKGDTFIGSMRFKEYAKAIRQTATVAKAVPDCSVLLVKLNKGKLQLMAYYEKGRKRA